MLNLAVLDCLVGNVDRHTRNFGLFYNSLNGEYKIKEIYKGVNEIKYIDILTTPFAKEYERRMQQLWQKLD